MIRAALIWLALALPAVAQGLPDWDATSITDRAGLLTAEDAQVLDQALIALNRETGVQGTVVTLTGRDEPGESVESFATRLFNHWGVGRADRNDGFMVLVLPNERAARIELGAGYPPEGDQIAAGILDETILPAFRAGDMSRGTREGTLDVIQKIARPHAAGETLRAPRDWPGTILQFGVFGVFALVFVQMIRHGFRRRTPCPECGGTRMVASGAPGADGHVTMVPCPRCGGPSGGRRGLSRGMPMSSGGGGGFGGGQSSGGGATGRW